MASYPTDYININTMEPIMSHGWPELGSKLRFLGKNGWEYQLKQALELFEIGQELTLAGIKIGSSMSYFIFEEVKGAYNTVMFEPTVPEA